jgi:hypothetical protein
MPDTTSLDNAFYKLTVQQRDTAWRQVDRLEKELKEAGERENGYLQAIQRAMDYASGRWVEWGPRAEGVRDILQGAMPKKVEEAPEEEPQELARTLVECGFASEQEFHGMVALVDLSSPAKMEEFKEWQHNDGSKAGLTKLLGE